MNKRSFLHLIAALPLIKTLPAWAKPEPECWWTTVHWAPVSEALGPVDHYEVWIIERRWCEPGQKTARGTPVRWYPYGERQYTMIIQTKDNYARMSRECVRGGVRIRAVLQDGRRVAVFMTRKGAD